MREIYFKEKMGSLYCMNEGDVILYEVTEPSVLFSKTLYTMHKIGNKQHVMHYYEECMEKCRKAASDLYEDWYVMDLPKDAELLNNILHRTGYMETFLKQHHLL